MSRNDTGETLMRPVGGVRAASGVRIGPTRDVPATDALGFSAAEPSRALIPVDAAIPTREVPTSGQRPYAGFLAHLIATADQLPQTRERRRAEPEDAIAAYRSTVNGTVRSIPGRFSRSS
jgi:hypothetical protein